MATVARRPIEVVESGTGRISLRSNGSEAVLSELSCSYPLKLLSPRLLALKVAVVYVLTYGGGLVAGDRVKLNVEVQDGAVLVLLTQGSTKVFKTRPEQRHARPHSDSVDDFASQRMNVHIRAGSSLFLLPDPVACFRSARYNQLQTFKLAADASIVLLDWITSGRKALGEDWSLSRYYSLNEVWVDAKRIARDAMLLEENQFSSSIGSRELWLPPRTLGDRLAPYSCYATVLLYGPLTTSTVQGLMTSYSEVTAFKHASRPPLIWSVSTICDDQGCVLRVAALETEDARNWLGSALRRLEAVVGSDIETLVPGQCCEDPSAC